MKRKSLSGHIEEEVESEGSWAISYGDMITLLLSFFVIFFSTDFDKKKNEDQTELVRSEIASVDFMSKESSPIHETASKKDEFLNHDLNLSNAKIEVVTVKNNLLVKFSGVSFFKSGSVDLTPEGAKVIRDFSEKYIPYASVYGMSVKAFTDQRKVIKKKDRFKDNLELSALRAISAMRELQKSGIPLTQMDIAGLGELVELQKHLGLEKEMSREQKNALSRTIVMIIRPTKEKSYL